VLDDTVKTHFTFKGKREKFMKRIDWLFAVLTLGFCPMLTGIAETPDSDLVPLPPAPVIEVIPEVFVDPCVPVIPVLPCEPAIPVLPCEPAVCNGVCATCPQGVYTERVFRPRQIFRTGLGNACVPAVTVPCEPAVVVPPCEPAVVCEGDYYETPGRAFFGGRGRLFGGFGARLRSCRSVSGGVCVPAAPVPCEPVVTVQPCEPAVVCEGDYCEGGVCPAPRQSFFGVRGRLFGR
jgi:hypothetical protein